MPTRRVVESVRKCFMAVLPRSVLSRCNGGFGEFSESGKLDRETRPFGIGAPAVALGRRANDRETEARARVIVAGSPEPLECAFAVFGREPGAFIGDAERTRSPSRAVVTVTTPLGGPCRCAFCTRLRSARSSAARSPNTRTGSTFTRTFGSVAATAFGELV